jgi:hypothetical protein
MMDLSAVIDAALALAGMAAVLAVGIRSLSDTSTTVSTPTNQESGRHSSELPKAA